MRVHEPLKTVGDRLRCGGECQAPPWGVVAGLGNETPQEMPAPLGLFKGDQEGQRAGPKHIRFDAPAKVWGSPRMELPPRSESFMAERLRVRQRPDRLTWPLASPLPILAPRD
jgi:hypothetical protein